jgi:hypothetical protein
MPEFDMDARTEETVGGDIDTSLAKTDFSAHPDSISARKARLTGGECRLVVEVFFDIDKKTLRELSDRKGQNFLHPVDYLRYLKEQFEKGDYDLGDLENDPNHTGVIRVEAAK